MALGRVLLAFLAVSFLPPDPALPDAEYVLGEAGFLSVTNQRRRAIVAGAAATLAAELAPMRDSTGAFADPAALPEADLTLVEYQADWCAPCRRQAAIAAFIGEHPETRVAWVRVEADPTAWGTPPENGRMIRVERDS